MMTYDLMRSGAQGMWGEGGPGTSGGSTSRSCPLHRPEAQIMAADALQLVRFICDSCKPLAQDGAWHSCANS